MNRRQPYEEALTRKVDNLPLPDEDAAWQKMNALLEEKNDRKPVFFWRWGPALLLTCLLAGLGVVELKKSKKAGQKILADAGTQTQIITPKKLKPILNHGTQNHPWKSTEINIRLSESHVGERQISNQKATWQAVENAAVNAGKTAESLTAEKHSNNLSHRSESSVSKPSSTSGLLKSSEENQSLINAETNEEVQKSTQKPAISGTTIPPENISVETAPNGNQLPGNSSAPVTELKKSLIKGGKDDADTRKSSDYINFLTPPIALKPKARLLSAGIAVQHPLQFSGQEAVAYGYNAGSQLSDYIPSVWLRYERPKRWYFQGEFIYSAPQLVNEFAFSRQTKADTGFNSITTVHRMKKTFFNQIPLSFNYYIKPNWSIGGGVGYAWLQGAITQRDEIRNTAQGQIVAKREIIPVNAFTDSFLYRSHSLVLLQTEYKWNRLSAGIKFTRDLQSFITYTAPDGRLIDKKNSALSVLLRFKLWQQ